MNTQLNRIQIQTLVLAGCLVSGSAVANPQLDRFGAFGQNYFIVQSTDDDERAIEANLSLGYEVFKCTDMEEGGDWFACNDTSSFADNTAVSPSILLTYTGGFDFYLDSRASGPVINRLNNPAIHFRFSNQKYDNGWQWFDFGIEHRSNGQVVSPTLRSRRIKDPSGQLIYLTEDAANTGNHQYFDKLNRESNYFSLTGAYCWAQNWSGSANLKYYFNQEAAITWGKYKDTNIGFDDFDSMRISLTKHFGESCKMLSTTSLGIEYIIGKNVFDGDSVNINFRFPLGKQGWELPLYVRAHFGPMDRLSDYARSTRSIGIGLEFTGL